MDLAAGLYRSEGCLKWKVVHHRLRILEVVALLMENPAAMVAPPDQKAAAGPKWSTWDRRRLLGRKQEQPRI